MLTKMTITELVKLIEGSGYSTFAYSGPDVSGHECPAYLVDRQELLTSVAEIVGWQEDEDVREDLTSAFEHCCYEDDGSEVTVYFPEFAYG